MNVGLCGHTVDTGIGITCRRLMRNLPFAKFLHVKNQPLGWGPDLQASAISAETYKVDAPDGNLTERAMPALAEFLAGLDAVVSIERWWPRCLATVAAAGGIRTALMVMPEWLLAADIKKADVLIAHSRCTKALLDQHTDKAVLVPFPMDLSELGFRRREVAMSFGFIDGWGGVQDRSGSCEVLEALRSRPRLMRVSSLRGLELPLGTEAARSAVRPVDLYHDLDVVVRPSRHEGLGIVLLEALACGSLVITTAGKPMCEPIQDCFGADAHRFLVRPRQEASIKLGDFPWYQYSPDPADLIEKVDALRGKGIAHYSLEARAYMERVHGQAAWQQLWKVICG